MPEGHIIGARGDHWNNHPRPKNPEAMKRFVDGYRQRFNEYPIYPCHHMAQAFSALQGAYARAIQAKGGGWPNDQELADAFRGLTFDSPTSTITLRETGRGWKTRSSACPATATASPSRCRATWSSSPPPW
jgi:branched-chain amino acid transport system substrate-binding protein